MMIIEVIYFEPSSVRRTSFEVVNIRRFDLKVGSGDTNLGGYDNQWCGRFCLTCPEVLVDNHQNPGRIGEMYPYSRTL